MIGRLGLVIAGAITAATATLAAFWARRRPKRGHDERKRPGRGTGGRRGGKGGAGRRAGAGRGAGARSAAPSTSTGAAEPASGGAQGPGAVTSPEPPVATTPSSASSEAAGLRVIKGIGAVSEERLQEAGVTAVAQVAAWSDADVETIAARIGVSAERIRREDWVGQARTLAEDD